MRCDQRLLFNHMQWSIQKNVWWKFDESLMKVTCGKRIRNSSSSLFGSYWVLWGASLNSLWRSFSFLRWVFTWEGKLRRIKEKEGKLYQRLLLWGRRKRKKLTSLKQESMFPRFFFRSRGGRSLKIHIKWNLRKLRLKSIFFLYIDNPIQIKKVQYATINTKKYNRSQDNSKSYNRSQDNTNRFIV